MLKLDLDFFENIFLYKCGSDKRFLASVIDITHAKYFKNKDNQLFFNVIKDFYEKRDNLPNLTEIKQYITKDEDKVAFKNVLQTFQSLDKNYNEKDLYENTEQFLKEKSVYHTMLDIASKISKGEVDTSQILEKFEKSCNISLQTDLGLDLYNQIDKVVTDLTTVDSTIRSKWTWLDEQLNGGFLEKGRALYVFAGETNIGKSIFLGNIAANIATQNKTVLVITLEMSELLYAKRICSNVSKIPLKNMHLETDALKNVVDNIKSSKPQSRILIKEFPPATMTARQIQSFIKQIEDKGIKIDAIVLDYLNLLHSTIGNNSYERIKHVTEQVRAMSYIFNCPVISATQLNRCLDVNTLVEKNDGSHIPIGSIKKGDIIKGNTGYVEVRYVYPREFQKCFKIKTKSGKEIICSGKHLFPTTTGINSINDGLKIGDKLYTN